MVPSKRLSPDDPNSYARPDIAKVTHIHLSLNVNFEKKILEGSATLTVEKVDPSATHLTLDARGLNLLSMIDDSNGSKLDFKLHPEEYVGSKLEVNLPKTSEKSFKIKIEYETTSGCVALQWLEPNQTAGKTHPYVFSQCQSIHCRSMVPCQDTPAVKMPYTAEITAPQDITILMSAIRQGDPKSVEGGKRLHTFEQKVPIQSYLIAIAGGKLESRQLGPRSHVWSEKEYVDKAAFDFSETETMIKTAEELCGPYVWGIYDILVLPPSFPYGGMENPCLTFATPTILAGDRSLADVIAHEIAHSWTGNLVTNKNFEHFWLNEGFTVFTERKIVGRMRGDPARHFSHIMRWKELKYNVDVMGHDNPLTALVPDLEGIDPEDAYSRVPYDKGATFLWYLEEIVGGPAEFEPFLKSYYNHFKYQSIDSDQFKNYFLDYFKGKDVSAIEWDKWFKQPGMPIYTPNFDQSLAEVCSTLRQKWLDWDMESPCPFASSDFESFLTVQKIEFLGQMIEEEPLPIEKLEKMQEVYKLDSYENCEIKFNWIRLGLKGKWTKAISKAVEMVSEQGRMKYVRPLYRDLYRWDESRPIALETFHKNKPNMMHVAIQGLEIDLKLVEK